MSIERIIEVLRSGQTVPTSAEVEAAARERDRYREALERIANGSHYPQELKGIARSALEGSRDPQSEVEK